MKGIADRLRAIFLVILALLAMVLCGIRLMKMQIVDGESWLEKSKTAGKGIQVINAARGEIVDINGKDIVKNKAGFNIIIEKVYFPKDNQDANEIVLKLAKILRKENVEWVETIPITKTAPYEYLPNSDRKIAEMQDDNHLRLAGYATAQDCLDALVEKYEISPIYTEQEKRIIAGIRYEMMLKSFSVSNRYTFAEDVPMDIVSKVKELSYILSGVDVVEEAIRVYDQGTLMPHAIGTVGAISSEEYETKKSEGYGLDDIIGKSGIEKAMEEYLRGKKGERTTTITNGVVTSIEVTKDAVPGNTVKLTVDSEFQNKVQDILEYHIKWLNENSTPEKGKNAKAGAVVVLDVKTGAVLAMANYPSYDINDYLDSYSEVANRENNPLLNRAINGLYRPGSTFKTVTATAALNEGVISNHETVVCNGAYTYYTDITPPKCTGYHSSGNDVVNALKVSCNIFFYDVGRRMGIDLIDSYASHYGLGEETGLEIGGQKGYIAGPATFERFGQDWTPGQVLQAAIGQSETNVTPMQMAVQASTIANRGVRYKPYLVDSIYSYDMSELIKKTEPTVAYAIDVKNPEAYNLIERGMMAAAEATFGEYSLNDLPGKAAIKTGTPQVTKKITNSAFIGYYPVDDPQIAFAGMVEEGEYSKYMIRKIIDAYFGYENPEEAERIAKENGTYIEPSQSSSTGGESSTLPAETTVNTPAETTAETQNEENHTQAAQ